MFHDQNAIVTTQREFYRLAQQARFLINYNFYYDHRIWRTFLQIAYLEFVQKICEMNFNGVFVEFVKYFKNCKIYFKFSFHLQPCHHQNTDKFAQF